MKKNLVYLLLVTAMLGFNLSCKRNNKDPKPSDPTNPNESELITTVKLVVSENGNMVGTFAFSDPDGSGGTAPTLDTIRLDANMNYDCEVILLDESKNPVDTLTGEVAEEATAHQFFYTPSAGLGFTVSYDSEDVDANGVPLGLYPKFHTTATTGIGSMTLVLKHQGEDKPKTGQGDSSIGDTDVEVVFPVKVTP